MSNCRSALSLSAIGVSVALGLTACGADAGDVRSASAPTTDRVDVVASTNVWGDIATKIGGNHVSVTSIISDPAQDPHSYEANATTQLKLSRADVVIENGGGYDDFVDSMLKTHRQESVMVINAVDVSGRRAPTGGELNEHVWYDFPTVAKVADSIAAALSAELPGQKATFDANARTFSNSLSALEAQEADLRKKHDGEGVAITEPVPLYLLQAGGLVDRTPEEFSEAIEEGTDVPAAVLNETLGLFQGGAVKALVYNAQTSGPETERVLRAAEASHVAVVPVTETLPVGQDYLSWMSSNVSALSAALQSARG